MKYIDTERQLTIIFTKSLDATHFASLWGGSWCLSSLWLGLRGELMFCLIYTLSCILLLFGCISSYLSNLSIASSVILACIWLIILTIILG
jgi:hypothetical protein